MSGGHKCAKTPIFDNFGGVVTIATADTPKLELRVCVEVKCESFKTCKKCAQNVWGGHKCAKIAIFDDFVGVVTIATADTPNPKLSWCGKFNCETRWACKKCAHML